MSDLPEHVARNRALWDDWARKYVASGERNWAREAPAWGVFGVPESERVPLPSDQYYYWELEGCTVKVGEKSIGKVQSVIRTGGTEILEIADENGKQRLIPLVDSIVVEIDTAGKTIIVDPPEGLLDL